MSITDPVGDYLSRIRNAIAAKHEKVDIPASRVKLELTKILKEEGFIQNYKLQEDKKQGAIRIFLRYTNGVSVITGLKQITKPGRRMFSRKDDVPKVFSGLGISIVSTSKGIMTGDKSHKIGVGGEVLCEIW
jgi:small subunit ribosomal protein S8